MDPNMRPLADFLPLVQPFAPGVPQPTALQALRLAAIEWCERTRCWRVIRTITTTVPDRVLIPFPYATVHEIEIAEFNGQKLEPIQFSDIDPDQITVEGGQPKYISQTSPNTLLIYPHAEGSLYLSLFLKPRIDAELDAPVRENTTFLERFGFVPDHIYLQSAEAIKFGALARLLAMPAQDWTDGNAAAAYELRFREKMDAQFSGNVTGQQRAARRTKPQYF